MTIRSAKVKDITIEFNKLLEKNSAIAHRHLNEPLWSKINWWKFQVKTGGPWDLKNTPEWNPSDIDIMHYCNEMITAEELGNIHYGYVGEAAGFSDFQLVSGAGVYQVWSGTTKMKWINMKSYGDDPRDTECIMRGINMYETQR